MSGKKEASDTASCALPASVRVRCASDAGKRGSDAVSELHSFLMKEMREQVLQRDLVCSGVEGSGNRYVDG